MSAAIQTLPGRLFHLLASPSEPPGSWEDLLRSALRTQYYSTTIRSSVLTNLLSFAPERAVEHLDPVSLSYYYDHLALFKNPNHRRPNHWPLYLPGDSIPRAAAVDPWFHLDGARIYRSLDIQSLERFRPRCVLAPPDVLVKLATAALEGRARLDTMELAVSLAGVHRPPMSSWDRDLFWLAFHLPVHEQFRGHQGELLASECEFHDGLHIEQDRAVMEVNQDGQLLLTSMGNLRYPVLRLATGMKTEAVNGNCGCGRGQKLRFFGTRKVIAKGCAT